MFYSRGNKWLGSSRLPSRLFFSDAARSPGAQQPRKKRLADPELPFRPFSRTPHGGPRGARAPPETEKNPSKRVRILGIRGIAIGGESRVEVAGIARQLHDADKARRGRCRRDGPGGLGDPPRPGRPPGTTDRKPTESAGRGSAPREFPAQLAECERNAGIAHCGGGSCAPRAARRRPSVRGPRAGALLERAGGKDSGMAETGGSAAPRRRKRPTAAIRGGRAQHAARLPAQAGAVVAHRAADPRALRREPRARGCLRGAVPARRPGAHARAPASSPPRT